jgi:hypothetical protein
MRVLAAPSRALSQHGAAGSGPCRGTWRPWLLAWTGGAVIAVANGTLRQLALHPLVGDTHARQLSTVTLLALLTGYMWELSRRWPIRTAATALEIGAVWVVLTLAFEFGFGHVVEGKAWGVLLDDYNVMAGHIWIVVPLWTVVAPSLVRRLQRATQR